MATAISGEDAVAQASNVLIRFFRCLDDGDYDGLATLLDGEWHRQGKVLSSRESVMTAMAQRSATRRIHHLLTNVCGVAEPDGRVNVIAYMHVISHDSGSVPTGPSPLTGVQNVRTLRAVAKRGDDGWRISYLKSDPASFERQDNN